MEERISSQEYAPLDRDRLAEELGGLLCIDQTECPLPKCFEDNHHTVYGTDLSEAELIFKTHPKNKERLCRNIHETTHKTWRRSEPVSDEYVVGFLIASPMGLKANQKKKIKELKQRMGKKDGMDRR